MQTKWSVQAWSDGKSQAVFNSGFITRERAERIFEAFAHSGLYEAVVLRRTNVIAKGYESSGPAVAWETDNFMKETGASPAEFKAVKSGRYWYYPDGKNIRVR